MSVQPHENRRRARKLAHRIAEDARRKRGGRYDNGGVSPDEVNVAGGDNIEPVDQPRDQDAADAAPPPQGAPQAVASDLSPDVTPGAQTGLNHDLVYNTDPSFVSQPTADQKRGEQPGAANQPQTEAGPIPQGRAPVIPARDTFSQLPGSGGYQRQTTQQIHQRFNNPLYLLGRAIAAWHEGTGALLNSQALERGEFDLENHRQFYGHQYQYGTAADVAAGLNGELGIMQRTAESAMNEHDHTPGAGPTSPGGAGGQGGTGAAGQAPVGGSDYAANLARSSVPQAYQAQQAQRNAMDVIARGAITNLMASGDPNMARAGAGLYTQFQNGELTRQMLAARISFMQQAMEEMRKPTADIPNSFEEYRQQQGGQGQAAPRPGAQREQPIVPPQGPTATDEQRTLGPTARADEPTRTYDTVPPTTVVPPAGAAGAAGAAGQPSRPLPSGTTAAPGPQEPTAPPAAGEPAAEPPQRVAQAEPERAEAPTTTYREIAQGLVPPGWKGHEFDYAQVLRGRANDLFRKAAIIGAGGFSPAASALEREAAGYLKQSEDIMGALKEGGANIQRTETELTEEVDPRTMAPINVPKSSQLGITPRRQIPGLQTQGAQGRDVPFSGDIAGYTPGQKGPGPGYAGQHDKFLEDARENAELPMKLEGQMQRLRDIQRIGAQYESGPWAKQRADAMAAARQLGFNTGRFGKDWSPTNYQEWMKDMIQGVYDEVNKLKGRVLTKEISGWEEALANPNMQPGAARHLTATMIAGLQQQINYSRGIAQYGQRFGNSYPITGHVGFDNDFFGPTYQQRLQADIDREENEHPFKGDMPIGANGRFDANKAVDGRVYISPTGKWGRWNKQTGKMEPMGHHNG
jgi:hypothetical protein